MGAARREAIEQRATGLQPLQPLSAATVNGGRRRGIAFYCRVGATAHTAPSPP